MSPELEQGDSQQYSSIRGINRSLRAVRQCGWEHHMPGQGRRHPDYLAQFISLSTGSFAMVDY